MDQRALVVQLEIALAEYRADDAAVRDVLLAGLRWPADTASGYWHGLAVGWIEQGAAVDAEVIEAVEAIAAMEKLPQSLRHKARAIVRDWHRKGCAAQQNSDSSAVTVQLLSKNRKK